MAEAKAPKAKKNTAKKPAAATKTAAKQSGGTRNDGHRPKVALVTGGAGFIGSNLVNILLDEGIKVRCLVKKGDPIANLEGLNVEQVYGNLLDVNSLRKAVKGCDTVFHFAAIFAYWLPNPALMYQVNVEGSINMMRAAMDEGVKKYVHVSSVAGCGTAPGEELANEDTPFNAWDDADDYILSKYIGQLEAQRFSMRGLNVSIVQPCLPFGWGDIAPTPTGILIDRYQKGENPFYFNGGLSCANVKDIARGAWLGCINGRKGEVYTLGGYNLTYKEFGELTCELAGTPKPKLRAPLTPFIVAGKINEWLSTNVTKKPPLFADRSFRYIAKRFLYFDNTKARTELGWELTPLEDALQEAIEWFRSGRDAKLANSKNAA